MKVSALMSKDVITVRPETPLKEVASLLAERRVSGAPVTDAAGKVLGIVSEADILAKEQGPATPHRGVLGWLLEADFGDEDKLAARTAGEAMTAPAITIGAGRQASEAARVMTEHGVKRLPVVDSGGNLLGILTRSDLVRAFARGDDDIAREIREIVHGTLWIDDERLHVGVSEGDVTLEGTVERRWDAELLPRFVARIPGVVSVTADVAWEWDDKKARGIKSDPRAPAVPRSR